MFCKLYIILLFFLTFLKSFYVIGGLPTWHLWLITRLSLQKMQEMRVGSLGQEEDTLEYEGQPTAYSCLGNSMERGAWWATVHRAAELDVTEELRLRIHMPLQPIFTVFHPHQFYIFYKFTSLHILCKLITILVFNRFSVTHP